MWPYPWTHVGTPSHLGHMDRVAATMPSQAHAGAAQEAPDIGQWEGQDVPLVRPSSCNVKGGIPSSRRYLPTYLPLLDKLTLTSIQLPDNAIYLPLGLKTPIGKPRWGSMLSVVDGGLAPVPWEDLDPAIIQEIQRESSGYTLDVLKNHLRPRDTEETTPGGDKYVVSDTVAPNSPTVYLILM